MLVLTRKVNQAISLGSDIKIYVLSIESDRVRIGIEAPASLTISRSELLEESKNINKEALETNLIFYTKDK